MEFARTVGEDPKFSIAKCPNCGMNWLAPGLRQGDKYECGDCAFEFVIGQTTAETVRSDSVKS